MSLQFGDFELDRERRQLLRSGRPLPLEPKAYELLVLLVERRPRALSRAQIRDVVWAGVFVSESTLGVAVSAIRQALGDDARQPRFIRTVHGFGYAFCGEVAGDKGVEAKEEVATAAEPRSPYPGLSSFTEEDAEVFFGREAEAEALWERLQRRRLLALIGPSGAGKTSFVRAGVIPARPEGWRALVSVPGRAPLTGLAHALAPEVAGDVEAVQQLVRIEDSEVAIEMMRRWRQEHDEALLVVDQLEELFTLNPPETRARFAALLGRLANEAGVHVLLSLRDDFLIRCSEHEAFAPVFSADMTPLLALERQGLRRALVEPAQREGFAFEDDSLVEEMLDSVEGARGALPLLAFAVSRLWEKRDRETGFLTQSAYVEIGGVAGALAQHAERTLERIGPERTPIVRELFRNLVTAQQTRAAADREELLSVLPNRESGAHVLDQLIDARLLTSYEATEPGLSSRGALPETGPEAEPRAGGMPDTRGGSAAAPRTTHRIEIVHESLLRAWPRLVRWQTQDEEGALLRDQLKQAAHLWGEKGRPDDLLWTGTSEREFELWRERYPGALTAVENDFAEAMVHRTRRRRRLEKVAVAGVVATALAVAAVVGVSRQQAVHQAERAAQEALRAEASRVLTLAQLHLEDGPTEALALATASLELSDTPEARVFATRALWEAPPVLELPASGQLFDPTFSPDGRWLAAGGWAGATVWAQTGERIATLRVPQTSGPSTAVWAPGGLLVTGPQPTDRVHIWSLPSGEGIQTIDFGRPSHWGVQRGRLVAQTPEENASWTGGLMVGTLRLRSWRLPDGAPKELGRVDTTPLGASSSWFEPNGAGWLYTKGRTIFLRPLPPDGRGDRVLSRHESPVSYVRQLPTDEVVFREESGRVHTCCSLSDGTPRLARSFPTPEGDPSPFFAERSGRWLVNAWEGARARLWSTSTWPAARPLVLRRKTRWDAVGIGFHPTGDWAVITTNDGSELTFWPLRRSYSAVVDGYNMVNHPLVFSPDGQWLASNWPHCRLRLWPVGAETRSSPPAETPDGTCGFDAAFGPENRFLFVAPQAPALIVPLDGSPVRPLEGFSEGTVLLTAALSPSGRRAAAALSCCGTEKTLRVWDLEKGEARALDLPENPAPDGEPAPADMERGVSDLVFVGESTLYSAGGGGIRRWDLDDGTHELVFASRRGDGLYMRLGAEGRRALVLPWRSDTERPCLPVELVDLRTGASEPLPTFGQCIRPIWGFALDASGTIAATGDRDGLVRVGRLGAGEPHLLAGHDGPVTSVALSPDLRWVASVGEDNTLRLWPMPDLDEPPLHTLPREELLKKLKSLTNLRAVRDAESETGWRIEVGPFPGWETVPTW